MILFDDFFLKDSDNVGHKKLTFNVRTLRYLRKVVIILVGLTMTCYSENMMISYRCICGGSMCQVNKKP